MSSPVRQMNHRRLPPLPGAVKHGATTSGTGKSGSTLRTPRGSGGTARKLQNREPAFADEIVKIMETHKLETDVSIETGCPSMSSDSQAQATDSLVIKGQRLSSPNQSYAMNPLLHQARSSSSNILRPHDRYRKVCQPLRWQIKIKKAKILSAAAVCVGCVISLPLIWIYGIYESELEQYDIFVSECSFKSTSSEPSFAFHYLMVGMVLFTSELIIICTMYCFIRKEIILHLYEKNVHKQDGPDFTTAQNDVTNASCLPNAATNSAKNNVSKQPKTDTESEVQATCKTNYSSPSTGDRLSDDDDEQTTTTYIADGEINEFEMTSQPTKPPEHKRTKSKGRTRTKKATFSMFLISLTFVLSYLPVLLLLLLRSVDEEFEPSLTDAGRTAYKFFLRLYVLNCATNPFIYGLSDSRFRGNCKDVLYRMKAVLNCKRTLVLDISG